MLNTQVTRLERPSKRADAGEHREPGVLHHLLGLRPAADDRGSDADERAVEPPDQRAVSLLVAAAQPGQEFRLVELGLTHEGLPRSAGAWPAETCAGSLRNVSGRFRSPLNSAAIGEGGTQRADLPRHERTGDGLPGARRVAPASAWTCGGIWSAARHAAAITIRCGARCGCSAAAHPRRRPTVTPRMAVLPQRAGSHGAIRDRCTASGRRSRAKHRHASPIFALAAVGHDSARRQ